MRNGEDSDVVLLFKIDDVVRKALHGNLSNWQLRGHARHTRTRAWQIHDLAYGGIYGVEEFQTETCSTTFIPTSGLTVPGVSLVLKPNA